jgi:hypothetical protein
LIARDGIAACGELSSIFLCCFVVQHAESEVGEVKRTVRNLFHGRKSGKGKEQSAKKPKTFRVTLPQKAERNDALFDL